MKKLLFAMGLALIAFSCSSDNDDHDPYGGLKQTLCKFRVETNGPDFVLSSIGGAKFIGKARFSGEIVPTSGINLFHANNGIKAYYGACPYLDPVAKINGELDFKEETKTYTCRVCSSEMNPQTGEALSGPAKQNKLRMLEYNVVDQGDGVYLITNNEK